jgi:hypothetical protein
MKIRFILFFFVLISLIGFAQAKNAGWEKTQKPSPSLIEAHQIALDALKDQGIDFFCLSATVARTFSECDWELHFSSSKGKEKWVSVSHDRKARVSEHGFPY